METGLGGMRTGSGAGFGCSEGKVMVVLGDCRSKCIFCLCLWLGISVAICFLDSSIQVVTNMRALNFH